MDYLKPAKDFLSLINSSELPELYISEEFSFDTIELGKKSNPKYLFPIIQTQNLPKSAIRAEKFQENWEIYNYFLKIKFDQSLHELLKKDLIYQTATYSSLEINGSTRWNVKVYRPTLLGSTWKKVIKNPFWETETIKFLKGNFDNLNIFLTSKSEFLRNLVKGYL